MFEDYNLGKKDCFAYLRGGYCTALDIMRCDGCSFYKTVEEHNEQIQRLARIQTTSEYKRAVAEIKKKQKAAVIVQRTLTAEEVEVNKSGDGYILYKWRKRKGLTQAELAQLLGCRPHNVWYFEKQEHISRRKKNEICAKLGLENNYFENKGV